MKRAQIAGAALALSLVVAACGSDDGGGGAATTQPDAVATTLVADTDTAEFPLTITHAFGATTIGARPERVAGVEWGNHDVALALGIVPVGMPRMSYGDEDGNGLLPWAEEALAALGVTDDALPSLYDESDGLAFEAVAAADPDVILAAYSGLDQIEYDALTAIAPTVAYPEQPWFTNWRDMALINGEALGAREQAEALIADVEARIADAGARNPDVAGKTVAYLAVDPENLATITLFNDARVEMLENFGMVRAEAVTALFEGTDTFHHVLSSERIDVLDDVDILAVYGDADTLAVMQADPLLSQVPAVRNGAVAVVIDPSPMAAAIGGVTILSLQWVLDDYFALFQAAAVNAS